MADNSSKKNGDGQYVLDDLDRQISTILKANGRASNQEIARQLDITAATVGARIRRLEDLNLMRIVAITDFAAAGYELLLAVGVEVQKRPAEDVARDLAKLPEVFSVNLVTGSQDIEILVAARDFDGLAHLLSQKLTHIEGIRNLSPALAVDVLKYLSDSVPLS